MGFFPDIDAVRAYFGEAVALYFAWLTFMLTWLCVPAILGIVVFGLNHYTGGPLR